MGKVFGLWAGHSATKTAAILLLLLWPVVAVADPGWYPERRRTQFQKDPGHIAVPAYLPLGSRSTWAFNYFRSDAHVLEQGETDPAVIAADQGLECDTIVDPVKQQKCRQYVDTIVAQNRYGSASSLGGLSRLRSYPLGRYTGAHTQFLGSEVRWNLTDEKTPFNIFVVKDIRTAIQVALFYELGIVADTESELWSQTRSNCIPSIAAR